MKINVINAKTQLLNQLIVLNAIQYIALNAWVKIKSVKSVNQK